MTDNNDKNLRYTNRQWENHLNSKGFNAFIMERLQGYALSRANQYEGSPFDFSHEDDDTNPLKAYYFNWVENFPQEFFLEITAHCNLKCPICPQPTMERVKGIMTDELYKKIIDEVAEKNPAAFVRLYGIGESTIDKKLAEKIAYGREKGVNLGLTTNGQLLLVKDMYKAIVDAGVNNIDIDIDGFSQEVYERIRVGGKFDTLKEAVEKLYDYVRGTGSQTRVVLIYHLLDNDEDFPKFLEWCKAGDYEYKLVKIHQWTGLKEDLPSEYAKSIRKVPCAALWSAMMIMWNGKITPCFFGGAEGDEVVGDVNELSIQEIWQTTLRQKRIEHVRGEFTGICKGCTDFTDCKMPSFQAATYPEVLRPEGEDSSTSEVSGKVAQAKV